MVFDAELQMGSIVRLKLLHVVNRVMLLAAEPHRFGQKLWIGTVHRCNDESSIQRDLLPSYVHFALTVVET